MNMMLIEHKAKLVKSCLSSSEVISLCARIRSYENSILDICNKYDVHCEMSGDRLSQNFRYYLYIMLKEEGKLKLILNLVSMCN